jgi:hypothetical protein
MRRSMLILVAVLLALAALPAAVGRAQDTRCFTETGQCISGAIRRYWEQNGGLPVFGYPITPVQIETVESWSGPVQWFERDRLEDHSSQGQGVLAGRLSVELLARQGRPWQYRQIGGQVADCVGFAETGYYMCGGFRAYWERNGGLARFGFPITDQINETINGQTYTVQYFERRRMEFHPENRPPFDILLGLLGNEVRGGGGAPAPTATPLPASQQILVDEPAENSTISSPVRISGRTTRVPSGGGLTYRVYEPNGDELASGSFAVIEQGNGATSFSSYIAYDAPAGSTVVIELTDRDRATGATIARTVRTVRYQPTTAQQITIDTPRSGARVGARVQVTGRTTIYPSEGDLQLNLLSSNGSYITSYYFGAQGVPGQPSSFYLELDIPDQQGRMVTIEVLDINQRGDVIARAQTSVFSGTAPYPGP